MSNKIFVEVELGLDKAKKEMSELQDFGVSIGIDEKDLKKVNELEKKIEGLENSFDKLSKTKLNTKDFQDAAKQIKADIDAVNKRIGTLSGKFDSIVSSLEDVAGVDTFQKMFQGALEGAKEVADTVNYTVKTVQQVGKVGQVELVTSKDKKELQEILDLYKGIIDSSSEIGFAKTKRKKGESDAEYIERLKVDLSDLQKEYDELYLSFEKFEESGDKPNKKIVDIQDQLIETGKSISATIEQIKTLSKKNIIDINGSDINLDSLDDSIKNDFNKIINNVTGNIERIKELFNQFQNSIDNGTAGTSKEVNRTSKGYGVPLYISTSPSTLTNRIREVLEVVQNNIAGEPIHVYLDVASDYRKNKYTKQLQEMAVDLTKINNPEIQEKLSKALMDLQEQVAGETVINIKTDVKSAEIEIRKAIKNIRIELNKRENKLHVSPDIEIPQSKIKKIQTELNRISKELTLNLNNVVISDKAIKDATGNGAKNKKKTLIDAKAIADTAALADLIDKIIESNKEFLSSDKAIAKSLLDIKNIVSDIKIDEMIEPIKELVSILYQFTGAMSSTDLDKMFDGMRADINDITGALRGNNLKAIKDVLSEYKEYKKAGGSRDISELGGAKNVQNWLQKHIDDVEKSSIKVVEKKIKSQEEHIKSIEKDINSKEKVSKNSNKESSTVSKATKKHVFDESALTRFNEAYDKYVALIGKYDSSDRHKSAGIGKHGINKMNRLLERFPQLSQVGLTNKTKEELGQEYLSSLENKNINKQAEEVVKAEQKKQKARKETKKVTEDVANAEKKSNNNKANQSAESIVKAEKKKQQSKKETVKSTKDVIAYEQELQDLLNKYIKYDRRTEKGKSRLLEVSNAFLNYKNSGGNKNLEDFTFAGNKNRNIEKIKEEIKNQNKLQEESEETIRDIRDIKEEISSFIKNLNTREYGNAKSIPKTQEKEYRNVRADISNMIDKHPDTPISAITSGFKNGANNPDKYQHTAAKLNSYQKLLRSDANNIMQNLKLGVITEEQADKELKILQTLDKTIQERRELLSGYKEVLKEEAKETVKNDILPSIESVIEEQKNLKNAVENANEALKEQNALLSNKTLVSSGEGINDSNINNSVNAIEEGSKAFEDAAESAQRASKAKDNFTESNQNLAKSAEETKKKVDKQNSSDEKSSKIIGIPENMKAILEPEVDKGDWNWVTDKVQELSVNLGKVLQIQRDVNGEFESYFVKFEKGSANLGKDSEQQLLRTSQQLLDIQDIKNYKSSADSKIKSINKILQVDEFGNPRTTKYTDEYIEKLQKLKSELGKFQNQLIETDGSNFEELIHINDSLEESYQRIAISERTFDENKKATENTIEGLRAKIEKFSNQNSAMGKQFANQLDMIRQRLQFGIGQDELKELDTELRRLEADVNAAGKTGDSFLTGIKKRIISVTQSAIAMSFSFYDIIRYARETVTVVTELDTALTELRKVSDASTERLAQSFEKSADTAKELGSTISDVINATSDWSRMGYDISDAEELARVATLFQNVGDNMTADSANSYLISTLQGFQMSADQAEGIVDKYNEVANHFAIDTAGIGEALQRSAASLNAANTDLSKSIALVTTANITQQNPEVVGTAFKTLSARIRGAKTELEDLGEEEDEFTQTTSKLRDLVQALTGFDIMKDENTYKDIYEIMVGIGEEWENLTDIEQQSLAESLAGKRNANVFYSVMNHIDDLEKAYQTAENSAGKIYYLYVQKCA